jgi:hypothetical protein
MWATASPSRTGEKTNKNYIDSRRCMHYGQLMIIESTQAYTHFIGLDNGCSSNGVALFVNDLVRYEKLPIKKERNYQKEEHNLTRIDVPGFRSLLTSWNLPSKETIIVMERPGVNPARFNASLSAVRCLEAELIVIEEFGFETSFIDSRVWQRALLPGVEGSVELKKASLALGQQMFPQFKIKKDADSLLIGYYWKNKASLDLPKPKPPKIKKSL